jgi:hypothetical protein
LTLNLRAQLQNQIQKRRPEASGTETKSCKHVLDGHAILTPRSGTACRAPTEEETTEPEERSGDSAKHL